MYIGWIYIRPFQVIIIAFYIIPVINGHVNIYCYYFTLDLFSNLLIFYTCRLTHEVFSVRYFQDDFLVVLDMTTYEVNVGEDKIYQFNVAMEGERERADIKSATTKNC